MPGDGFHASRHRRAVHRDQGHLLRRGCPVDCIHPTKNEPDFGKVDQLYIDPDTCIDCGLCVDECPVKAIYPEEDLPGEWKNFVQLNLDYYKEEVSRKGPVGESVLGRQSAREIGLAAAELVLDELRACWLRTAS